MNREEALRVADNWIARVRNERYAELVLTIDAEPVTKEVVHNGTRYQLELVCAWDSHPGGDVQVMASIDDGGMRAFFPLTRDFIKRSDDTELWTTRPARCKLAGVEMHVTSSCSSPCETGPP